ncbi:MAG: FHA domain-containing protein [Chloroflexi bacterium]|nr:FHA domain-containing protein [Chloroflexota bacterium]MBP8059218.1 FHA domain-containing protein [Chloroflexota bacterium]
MFYELRRVSIGSGLKFGLFFGFLGGVLAGLFPILGEAPAVPGLLQDLLLTSLDEGTLISLMLIWFITLFWWLLMGSVGGVVFAAAYNLLSALTGGFVVYLEEKTDANMPHKLAAATDIAPDRVTRLLTPEPPPASVVGATIAAPVAAAPAIPHAWLLSEANQQSHPLTVSITRLGSAPDNQLVLPGLSPHHAEIRHQPEGYILYDLGSQQTWVHGRAIAGPHRLKSGFRLQLGQHSFTFQTDQG